MQLFPTLLGTVVMPFVSPVVPEFQNYYNTLTLEPQDVVKFGCQIASGMVSKDTNSGMECLVTDLFHFSLGVLGQPEHHPQRPCLQEHRASPRQSGEAS